MENTVFKEEEYKKNLDFQLWKKIFKYVKPYYKLVFFLAFVMTCVAGVDAVFPLLTKKIIDDFIIPKNMDGLVGYILLYALIIVIQVINVWFLIAIAGKVETHVVYDIRKHGFKHLQDLSFSYYDKTPVGWLMARMTSDSERMGETIAWGLVDIVWGIAMMIFVTVIMLILNWKLALLVLCIVPLLAIVSIKFQKKILASYRGVRKNNSKITGAFNEGIMGAKTTKTLVREEANLAEFGILTKNMYKTSVSAAVQSSIYLPLVLIISTFGTGLVLWIGGYSVTTQVITYGTLVAFIAYAIQFFEPIREVARVFAELQNAQASAERLFSMIEKQPDIIDDKSLVMENPPESFEGNIEFKEVNFQYVDGEKVLEDFNLKIKAGEKVAIVGETGSGKSTLVNLVCRFYQPVTGEILIDDIDYRKLPLNWLQSKLGYVLQTPFLFSGTVKDNIRYGRLEATDEEIVEAAKMVNADNFISKLEKGYDNEVGEGGNLLSTGQKQLISFARAVIANPGIFILDEATSSVDTETEQLIQEAIHKVMEGRTCFIIAHRLSTIRSADRILVMSKGKVIEEGTHQDLIRHAGVYYQLYTNQFLEEKELEILHA